jgi:Flp pilus assembly protein CpaB
MGKFEMGGSGGWLAELNMQKGSIASLSVAVVMGLFAASLAGTWLKGQAEMARREAALAPRPKSLTGLEDGERALMVNVENAGAIKPGDRVDVVMVRKGYAKTILNYVKVIAIDKTTATLAVLAAAAPKVLLAGNVGKLSLAASGTSDASATSGTATDAELENPAPDPKQPDGRVTVTVVRAGVPTQYKVTKS